MRQSLGKNLVEILKRDFIHSNTKRFQIKIQGKVFEGFAVCREGKYYAYKNLCKHLPVTLDLNDNQFLTHDKRAIQCSMHGAIFEIDTGECTQGPCLGAYLDPLELKEEANRIVIYISPENIDE